MPTPENPFDNTVWDPVNPEHAIEDPLHGPSAVADMLEVPAMPLGDGTYYQTGGFYSAAGTTYFDANNQPIYRIGSARSMASLMHEIYDVAEWREASIQGPEALTALEAARQQARLEKNHVAHAFKPSDVCGGGKRLDECETAIPMVEQAKAYADNAPRAEVPGEGKIWTVLAWLGGSCTACSLDCSVAYETRDGVPTGITRFSNTRPLPADFPVVRIDLSGE